MKKQSKFCKQRFQQLALGVVLFLFVSVGSGVYLLKPKPAQAFLGLGDISVTIGDIPRYLEDIWNTVKDELGSIGAVLYKNALNYFLQRVAYDTATYLATGNKGQTPLFWDEGFGKYLLRIGDEAVGDSLDKLGRDVFGKSLCEPLNPQIQLAITLQAKKVIEPRRAKCTFTDIAKQDLFPDIYIQGSKLTPDLRLLTPITWNSFANYFDPSSHELGASFIAQSEILNRKVQDEQLAVLLRQEEGDIQSLKSPIGKLGFENIKTPSIAMQITFQKSIEDALSKAVGTYTGEPLADAVTTFTNTFASKFMQRLQKGLLSGGGGASGGGPGDFGSYGYSSSLGRKAAEATYAEFITPSFRGSGELDILSSLTACPSSVKSRQYNNCIINKNLATAIEQKMTVREAVTQGYLDLNKTFGFYSDGSEPTYNDGYSYRSLVFLRKYRIIPVTWELAALYIRDVSPTSTTYSLASVLGTPANDFAVFNDVDSPFYHLIDPNWVLKIPEFECRAEGPGPHIAETVNETIQVPDPNDPTSTIDQEIEIIQRNSYCADEVSCIVENPNGTCQKTGYCVSERDIWRFQGESCEPQQASCETYVSNDGQRHSYLANTLYNCNSSDVGCRWYSAYKTTTGEWAEDIWNASTTSAGSDGLISFGDVYNRNDLGNFDYVRHFNSQLKTCNSANQGCEKLLDLSNINPPSGYGDDTESIFQYVQANQTTYAEAGYLDSYGEWGRVQEKYLKLAPPYYYCPIDITDPDRDVECDNFAQSCDATEVGCSLYTPVNGDPPVPAVVQPNDYCSSQCVGYDQYSQQPTYFELRSNPSTPAVVMNLIPTTGLSCGAGAVGCEEFTNLDEVAQGGEGIEYFSYLRECISPNDPAAKVFYTWEGSDTTGYQLKTWHLLQSGGAPVGDSCSPSPDNLGCRTFLDASGSTWPRDIDTVVFSTEDCHPYRRDLSGEVIYGIASLSNSCRQAEVGCHAYKGNTGNVIAVLINNDFESGTGEGWANGGISNESVYVGGHSLSTNGNQVLKRVDSLVEQNKTYTLSFWARSSGSASLSWEIQAYEDNASVKNDFSPNLIKTAQAQVSYSLLSPVAGTELSFGSVSVGADWQYYQIGPLNFDRAVYPYEFLQTNGADVYLDNIIMREINDSYYLVADSWVTPAECDQPFVGAQLGCQTYTDVSGNSLSLLGFSSLCSGQAVGCKAMIDTKNSDSPFSETFNTDNNTTTDPDGWDDITVSNDNLIYVVDDPDKYCSAANVGCQLYGEAVINRQTNEVLGFDEKFVLDNPENYNSILCGYDGLYCTEYTNDRTRSPRYFVDPGDRVCEYRVPLGSYQEGWYEQGTDTPCAVDKVCSNDLDVSCSINSDCTGGGICMPSVPNQPIHSSSVFYDGWAGSCSDKQAGCSQYIDPEGDKACSNNQDVSCSGDFNCQAIPDYLGGVSNGICRPNFINNSYYNAEQSVDTSSCNGIVDRERGCRLFNKVDGSPAAYTTSAYSAVLTPDGSTPQSSATAEENDANIILAVEKDRVCSQWLYCRTRVEAYDNQGNRADKCFDIGLCDSLNPSGECNGFPNVLPPGGDPIEIVGEQRQGGTGYASGQYTVEDLRRMTGFTKAGMKWFGYGVSATNSTLVGYWPYSKMLQVGNDALVISNSNFEETMSTSNPLESPFINWEATGSSCPAGNCQISADKDAADGLYSAKLAATNVLAGTNNIILSQSFILPVSEYALSGYIKWGNIGSGSVSVKISDSGGGGGQFTASSDYSNNWERFTFRFKNNSSNVTIALSMLGTDEGEAYFDNLQILPVLQVTSDANGVLVGQSCRMYPKADSPECVYQVGSKQYNGWLGYCVEPDPSNINYCVNWWPVDVTRGSMSQVVETPLVFGEKAPLYYCVQAKGYQTKIADMGIFDNNNYIEDSCSSGVYNFGYWQDHYKYVVAGLGVFYWNGECSTGDDGGWGVFGACSECGGGSDNVNDDPNDGNGCGNYQDLGGEDYVRCKDDLTCDDPGPIQKFAVGGCANQDEEDGGASSAKSDKLIDLHNVYGKGITLPETQFYDYEIEKIQLDKVGGKQSYPDRIVLDHGDRESSNGRFGNLGGSYMWGVDCGLDNNCAGGNSQDRLKFAVVFDSSNHPTRYYIYMDDKDGDGDNTPAGWTITYYLREYCTSIVKVAEVDNGEITAVPYWTKFSPYGGNIPVLNYGYDTDASPFGSSYQSGIGNENDPTTWDYNNEPGKQPLYILGDRSQVTVGQNAFNYGPNLRGGTPYACQGDCNGSYCVGGDSEGIACDNQGSINSCYIGDGGINYGVCIGSPEVSSATRLQTAIWGRDQLRKIFARPVASALDPVKDSQWTWNAVAAKYEVDQNLWWDDTGSGSSPVIGNIEINNDNIDVLIAGGGGTVKLSFTSNIAPDQLPLRSYTVDWGDGTSFSVQGYYDERPSPGDPHIVYHTYSYNDSNQPRQGCPAGSSGVNCKYHTISITLKDNWDKSTTVSPPFTITVEQ